MPSSNKPVHRPRPTNLITVKSKRVRSTNGIQTIELAFGSLAIILMTMLALDLLIPMLGNSVLDRAARDAARAAASQGSLSNAIKAANAALASHKTDGFWITQPVLTSTSSPAFVYNDYGGDPTKGNPYVLVTCATTVRMPIPIAMFGSTLNGTDGNGGVKFTRAYQFPIIKFQLGQTFQ
ncbi:MAG: hypothetical protein P4L53_21710 [Candidatus Obscuribacterales bacterium]|nr:hypothetical protein [Candidatus Obscuribacterales bacterium]